MEDFATETAKRILDRCKLSFSRGWRIETCDQNVIIAAFAAALAQRDAKITGLQESLNAHESMIDELNSALSHLSAKLSDPPSTG